METTRWVVLKPGQTGILDNLQNYRLKDITLRPHLAAASGEGQLLIQDYWTKTKTVFEALKGNQPQVIVKIPVSLNEEMLYALPFSTLLRGNIELLWSCAHDIQLLMVLRLYGGGDR